MTQPELATCHFIVPHPKQAKFMLVKHSDGRWLPPQTHIPTDFLSALSSGDITEALLRNYGLQVTLLRQLQRSPKYHCIEVEVRPSGVNRKLEAVWVGKEEYARYKGSGAANDNGTPDAFERWLDDAEKGREPALRRPWERRGWFEHASKWLIKGLEQQNYEILGAVRQVRALSPHSAVLRVRTTQGNIFLKAGNPEAYNEATLTTALAGAFPNRVVHPLAVHPNLPWMLNQDFGESFSKDMDLRTQQQMLFAMADLQMKASKQPEFWNTLGVPNHGMSQIAEFLLSLEQQRGFLQTICSINDAQFTTLLARTNRMASVCREIAQSPVPESVVHTEFLPRKVYPNGDRFFLSDWGRACYGHPFMCLLKWQHQVPDAKQAWPAYLDPFRKHASEKELLNMLDAVLGLELAWQLYDAFDVISSLQPGEVFHENYKRGITFIVDRILSV